MYPTLPELEDPVGLDCSPAMAASSSPTYMELSAASVYSVLPPATSSKSAVSSRTITLSLASPALLSLTSSCSTNCSTLPPGQFTTLSLKYRQDLVGNTSLRVL